MDILGSIVGAVGSLFGSSKNSDSVRDTNRTNLKIAQMNNEFNERMLQKQMGYNTEMWNKQNEYNTASNQRKRLEEAGLNPYMMMNGGSAGTAQSAQGVNPPTATPVTMQAPQYDLSTPASFLQQAIELESTKSQRDANAKLLDNQANGVFIENQYKAQKLLSEIQNTKADTFFKRSAENLNAMNYARMQALFSSDVMKAERQAQNEHYLGLLTQAQTITQLMQGRLTDKELQYYDQKALGELAVLGAQQYSLVSQGKQSEAQARNAIANALESEARTRGIQVDNHIKNALINTTIGTARQVYREQIYNAQQAKDYNDWYRSTGKYADFAGGILNTLTSVGLGWGLGRGGFKSFKKMPKIGFR